MFLQYCILCIFIYNTLDNIFIQKIIIPTIPFLIYFTSILHKYLIKRFEINL